MIQAAELKQRYMDMLSDWCDVEVRNGHLRVCFPYLDYGSDIIEAYITQDDAGIAITDYGMTLGELEPWHASSSATMRRFDALVAQHGYCIDDGSLVRYASDCELVRALHDYVHIRLVAQGIFRTARRHHFTITPHAIADNLRAYGVEPNLETSIVGRRHGLTHSFSLSWSENGHMAIARATTNPDSAYADRFAFAVDDVTHDARGQFKPVAFIPPGVTVPLDRKPGQTLDKLGIRVVPVDRLEEAVSF